MKGYFNFRHVLLFLGIASTNETNWEVGQILHRVSVKLGFEKLRILTEKTNPDPTVSAPHCICHYPMAMWPAAIEAVRDAFENRARQQSLFGDLPVPTETKNPATRAGS
jgi:hypothetical protein